MLYFCAKTKLAYTFLEQGERKEKNEVQLWLQKRTESKGRQLLVSFITLQNIEMYKRFKVS